MCYLDPHDFESTNEVKMMFDFRDEEKSHEELGVYLARLFLGKTRSLVSKDSDGSYPSVLSLQDLFHDQNMDYELTEGDHDSSIDASLGFIHPEDCIVLDRQTLLSTIQEESAYQEGDEKKASQNLLSQESDEEKNAPAMVRVLVPKKSLPKLKEAFDVFKVLYFSREDAGSNLESDLP